LSVFVTAQARALTTRSEVIFLVKIGKVKSGNTPTECSKNKFLRLIILNVQLDTQVHLEFPISE